MALARRRATNAEVLDGSAERLPLADRSVDVIRACRTEVMSRWRFERRGDLEAVLRMELPAEVADGWLEAHPGAVELTYGYVLFDFGP